MSVKKNSINKFTKHIMSGAALSVLATHAAYAQNSAQDTQDEIIVSATKREQTLREVPIAVSVVDGDVIEKAQILDLIDLQSTVPSLRVVQLQNSSQTNFLIRGFGNGANNPGIESAVGVFVDGVFRSRSASSILDLPTLERVEVLRGPQSTLFGKNVSVGAINLTTKKPTFDWEGTASVTYGNLDQLRFRGSIAGPLTDTLAFRISGSTNNRDGAYTNLVTGEDNINDRDRWGVRGQLLWEPTDKLSFRAIGEYNRIDEVCCGAVQLVNGPATQAIAGILGDVVTPVQDLDAREVALDTIPVNELVGRGGSLQGDWDLGWAQVTSITSYREQTDFNQTDVDFSGSALATQPQDQLSETFTQELRISGYADTGFGGVNWIAGGFLFDEDLTFERDVIFGSDLRDFIDAQLGALGTNVVGVEALTSQVVPALTFGIPGAAPALFPGLAGGITPAGVGTTFLEGQGVFGDYELDNRSYSLFGQFDWEVTDRLTLTGGISYVNDRKITVGNSLLTDVFSSLDLVGTGAPLVAAGAFEPTAAAVFAGVTGQGGALPVNPLTGVPFTSADFAFDPTNPAALISNAFALQAVSPGLFAAIQPAAEGAGAALAGTASNPLLGLTAVQFFQPQVNFPAPGVVFDPDNTLADDGFFTDGDVNYTGRVAYDFADFLNGYFSYSTGYKASAVNLSSDSFVPTQLADGSIVGRFAEPEEVTTFEIGAKAAFAGGYLNLALFQQDVDNFQINIFQGTAFTLVNAGEQRVRGFEVDAGYSLTDELSFTFGLTYLDPEFLSFEEAPCSLFLDNESCAPGQETFDASGLTPSGIHDISLSTSANYVKELNNGATISGRLEYLFENEVRLLDNLPADITRRVSVFNANVGVQLENGLNVNLFGRNLTDQDFLLSGFPTAVQAGSFSGYVSQPRTYGVSVGFEF